MVDLTIGQIIAAANDRASGTLPDLRGPHKWTLP